MEFVKVIEIEVIESVINGGLCVGGVEPWGCSLRELEKTTAKPNF